MIDIIIITVVVAGFIGSFLAFLAKMFYVGIKAISNKKGESSPPESLMWVEVEGENSDLFSVIKNGDLVKLKIMLDQGVDVNAKNNDGDNALLVAAKMGHASATEFLLGKGADVNAKNDYGDTALIFAVTNDHIAVVETLLEKGADLSFMNKAGNTAMMLAKRRGNKVISLLLARY